MQLLFSVTRNDLTRQTFCGTGPGGQHKNATQNCVRLTHPPSGAVGTGTVHREQYRNEHLALQALAKTKEFKSWHKLETARRLGQKVPETEAQILSRVDKMIEDGLRTGQILIEPLSIYFHPGNILTCPCSLI